MFPHTPVPIDMTKALGWKPLQATGINVIVAVIGPELAEELLIRNTHNRNPVKSNIHMLKTTLEAGHWQLTHQGIAFDHNGVLLDGQNRLIAIKESGVPAEMMLFFNLPPETFMVLDDGSKRTQGQRLQQAGHSNSNNLAALARMVDHEIRTNGNMDVSLQTRTRPDYAAINALVDQYPSMTHAVALMNNHAGLKRLMKPSALSWFLHKVEQYKGPEAAEQWALRLKDPQKAGLAAEHPISLCYKRLVQDALSRHRSDTPYPMQLAMLIRAFNCIEAERLTVTFAALRWRPQATARSQGEEFPRFLPAAGV